MQTGKTAPVATASAVLIGLVRQPAGEIGPASPLHVAASRQRRPTSRQQSTSHAMVPEVPLETTAVSPAPRIAHALSTVV